jgi:uncharacterized surface protein with fasciclin (FAS1) repeats
MLRSVRTACVGLFLTLGLAACNGENSGSSNLTITELAASSPELSTLVAALGATGLDEVLAGPGPFTVFAPTNAAFAALPAGVVDALLNDLPTLEAILKHHVVAGAELFAADVVGVSSATTAQNDEVLVGVFNGTVLLDGIAQVTTVDIGAANGVVHIIDGVILPQGSPFPGDLVDAVSAYPVFSSLLAAVGQQGLATNLMGPNLTLFAPTNFAFSDLAVELGQDPLTVPNLTQVLTFHVVPQSLNAAGVLSTTPLNSLEGSEITKLVNGDVVTLDDRADIVRTDLQVDNGFLHVIDAVILP